MALLEVKNLSISFGGLKAVDNFQISIEKGQLYGLIGPNGAGKTTIFNLLTGVYKPDAGSIELDGVNVTGRKTTEINQAGIARTFQNIRLFSNLSVIQNVVIACGMEAEYSLADALVHSGKYRKTCKRLNEKAMGLLDIVGLSDKAQEKANSLPYGHQRKLEIARAMALDPKLLLLDEPAAGMNADESAELVGFIKDIQKKFDLTILMIEHHMDVVASLCDNVTVLNFGKTLCMGTPDEVKTNKLVVEAYLGGEDDA